MASKAFAIWGSYVPHMGTGDSGSRRPGFALNWKRDTERSCNLRCFGFSGDFSALLATKPVEDENPASPTVELQRLVDQFESKESRRSQKDSNSLPKPLSVTNPSSSASNGSNVRVAYQGVPGAHSEAAALKAYPQCEAVPCDQFEAAFKAVELWLVDKAVLPIENSLGGSIHRNYDLLLRHRLHIVGEVQLAVNHCLLGLPGVRKEELKRVLSHPQALAQCENTLSKLVVVRESVDDTAGAAQFVAASGLRDTGAVASARAAEIYGLNILAEKIQDDPENITRFLVLAREPIIPRTDRPFKTSIVFTLEEGPGIIFKALAVFALRDINLTKIESRPQRKRPLRVVDDSNTGSAKYFDYLFYIDFEASMADPRAQNALGNLQEFATFLRVLGSYPMDTIL
ncbi:arogenate dehydratase/prephenate dehydratase 1, chloroplastic-like [Telopea speciosissima]|uniref:arogenate dehydratase/prephenate dehydratase 1, chloroplastic-like n=1 Tax=Telopea speciosissima TaxID=54955 RepID=UPI001CC41F5B|nr:arogenate dehydratase/prephenate dehydratase 1, chloroplastic-like [Telopea speciosissima]